MTCDDVQRLLHPFVDTELPPPMLLAVARHAGVCSTCDGAIRELTELREVLTADVERDVDGLDLSGVWAGVSVAIERHDKRAHRITRLRASSFWGPALALAASLMLAVGLGRYVVPRPDPVAGQGAVAPQARNVRRVAAPRPTAYAPASPVVPASLTDAPATMPRQALRQPLPPNRAAFDRLLGKGIEVRREPKSGTTVVWVNHVQGFDE